jgi:hypothetical protein
MADPRPAATTSTDATVLADDLAVFASARLIDTGVRIGAVSFAPDDRGRGLGDGRTVSGWSLFVGDETDEELEDPERIRMPTLSWILERDPGLADLTDAHDATAGFWVREDDGAWRRVPD